jgi:hypothetical protein
MLGVIAAATGMFILLPIIRQTSAALQSPDVGYAAEQ